MNRHLTQFVGVVLGTAVLSFVGTAWPQAYPSRSIRLVAPQPPGGGYDYFARLVAERLQSAWGQPAVVDNKAGAATIIGTEFVAKQPPDGYTLLVTTDTHVVLPALHAKLPYDALKDFQPVILMATVPFVLTVGPGFPGNSVKEYVALARERPGAITFGSSGVGGALHLAGELLKSSAGIDIVHVPYKGVAAIAQAMLSGEITSSFAPVGPLMAQLRAGKVRAIAVLGPARSVLVPDVPSLAEGDGPKGYEWSGWFGVLAPAGTPRPVIERLNAEIGRAVRDPQFARERILSQGYEPLGTTPEQFMDVMKADTAKVLKVVSDAKIPQE
jgi:tripartite-type tricarboxylate transporter receptor subunit TctC